MFQIDIFSFRAGLLFSLSLSPPPETAEPSAHAFQQYSHSHYLHSGLWIMDSIFYILVRDLVRDLSFLYSVSMHRVFSVLYMPILYHSCLFLASLVFPACLWFLCRCYGCQVTWREIERNNRREENRKDGKWSLRGFGARGKRGSEKVPSAHIHTYKAHIRVSYYVFLSIF
jgi:hypothetical protein